MKINQINNRYEELAADANGEKQLSRVKSAVVRIKKDIKDTSLTEGVMQNTLFHCMQMRTG